MRKNNAVSYISYSYTINFTVYCCLNVYISQKNWSRKKIRLKKCLMCKLNVQTTEFLLFEH